MSTNDTDIILLHTINCLSQQSEAEKLVRPHGNGPLPSVDKLREFINNVKTVIFPDFFDPRSSCPSIRQAVIGVKTEKILTLLSDEIGKGFQLHPCSRHSGKQRQPESLALGFLQQLPEIKRMLYTDVEAMYNNDPAVDEYSEVILSYPVIQAMLHYRVANALLKAGIPVLPRIITELAHSATGIDINPGAEIGEYFAIDHGTGVVIGQTCIIGNHVTVYQGVTLGAKNFTTDDNGHPINLPRHPIIEDNVTIYSNASILGRITVGHHSTIGGNVWLTQSVPPHSRVIQASVTHNISTQ